MRVEKISLTHLTKYYMQATEELFETNNAKLCEEAIAWLNRTAENCSIVAVLIATVAVLIATVAFTAAYTVFNSLIQIQP